MCGIFAVHGTDQRLPPVKILAHRGPDSITCRKVGKTHLEFNRLAINGGPGAIDPLTLGSWTMVANAEIYNALELGGRAGDSDCEVILPLIRDHGLPRTCQMLNGDFAFVFTDGNAVWAARDRVGVRPLFWTRTKDGIAFASEMKGLLQFNNKIEIFPPGHLYDSKLDAFVSWAPNYWDCPIDNSDEGSIQDELFSTMFSAVERRVTNTERPVGFFLSGGLDSSIIAALGQQALGSAHRIRTFSIGLKDSPDLIAAREMAEFLDSDHTEVLFTIEEGLAALKQVVRHTETFDTTTIRASTPMFLLSKYIKENTDIRVVLSGEGSDELFGGYLYFHGAPSMNDFHYETMRLVRDVHMFDVLRADRTTAAHGLELRVPFFDKNVISFAMEGFDPHLKLPRDGFEKWILRKTFQYILPHSIAWRQKNGMSDAVGYGWADALRNYGEHNYKKMFLEIFGRKNEHVVPYQWMPKWSPGVTDPSARVLKQFGDPVPPSENDDLYEYEESNIEMAKMVYYLYIFGVYLTGVGLGLFLTSVKAYTESTE